jgi:hypothetical protein
VSRVPTIIIVDDRTGLQGPLCQILLDAGYSVRAAAHRSLALKMLHEKTPAIVLMDWSHDGMSAGEFIEAAQAQFSDVEFIITTAHEGGVQSAGDMGVRHVLRKPFQVDGLIEAVGSCAAGLMRTMRANGSSSRLPVTT